MSQSNAVPISQILREAAEFHLAVDEISSEPAKTSRFSCVAISQAGNYHDSEDGWSTPARSFYHSTLEIPNIGGFFWPLKRTSIHSKSNVFTACSISC
jgi:hypothetical protein